MPMPRLRGFRLWLVVFNAVLLPALAIAALICRDDILQALMDPKVPYAIYKPPPAPHYSRAAAWALEPGPSSPGDPPADVFFVHPTTYDRGKQWNGPYDSRSGSAVLAHT